MNLREELKTGMRKFIEFISNSPHSSEDEIETRVAETTALLLALKRDGTLFGVPIPETVPDEKPLREAAAHIFNLIDSLCAASSEVVCTAKRCYGRTCGSYTEGCEEWHKEIISAKNFAESILGPKSEYVRDSLGEKE